MQVDEYVFELWKLHLRVTQCKGWGRVGYVKLTCCLRCFPLFIKEIRCYINSISVLKE